MPVMFFIFFGSDLSKMDQIWSNWISHQSENITIKSCHLYRKGKNDCFVFDFFYQICPKWIKLDPIGFLPNLKNVTIKSCHIYRKDKNDCFVFDFFGSDLSKLDQTWSNLIKFDQSFF